MMIISDKSQAYATCCTKDGPPLSDRLHTLVDNSIAASSKRAYRSDLLQFMQSGGAIPASAIEIAEYIATLSVKHSCATISRRLVSIGKAHRLLGFENPVSSDLVRMAMRGARQVNGIAQNEARPLLKEDLFILLSATRCELKDYRDRALLLIGFAGGFRRSELVGLNFDDLERVREGLVLTLRRSKTDQEGKGRRIGIPVGRGRWCPVNALEEWLSKAGVEDGPIFRLINRHGQMQNKRLSGEAVALILRDRAKRAGLETTGFSGHSIRAGFVTSAVRAGASSYDIRRQTGHASDAMLSRYVREANLFHSNAAAALL